MLQQASKYLWFAEAYIANKYCGDLVLLCISTKHY